MMKMVISFSGQYLSVCPSKKQNWFDSSNILYILVLNSLVKEQVDKILFHYSFLEVFPT